MAATRLIALHINKGKTLTQCLRDRFDYAENPDKTEKGKYIRSYMCDVRTCCEEFLLSKRKYERITGKGLKKVQFLDGRQKLLPLFGKHFLPHRDAGLSLQAERQVFFHLLNAEITFFQADQILNPLYIVLVKDTMIVSIPFYIRYQPLIAVKFQGLIRLFKSQLSMTCRIRLTVAVV